MRGGSVVPSLPAGLGPPIPAAAGVTSQARALTGGGRRRRARTCKYRLERDGCVRAVTVTGHDMVAAVSDRWIL